MVDLRYIYLDFKKYEGHFVGRSKIETDDFVVLDLDRLEQIAPTNMHGSFAPVVIAGGLALTTLVLRSPGTDSSDDQHVLFMGGMYHWHEGRWWMYYDRDLK